MGYRGLEPRTVRLRVYCSTIKLVTQFDTTIYILSLIVVIALCTIAVFSFLGLLTRS